MLKCQQLLAFHICDKISCVYAFCFQSKSEALVLVKQMALFYGGDASHRHTLVRMFNKTPDKFEYMDVIEEYKRNRTYLEDNPY